MPNKDLWNQRWQAVANTLDEMHDDYGRLSTPTFQTLTTCLKAFGGDQFNFFLEGFAAARLLPSPEYPAENILRATLDQVSYDMTAVQLAVDQRVDGSPAMQNALTKADVLAQDALALAVRAGLIASPVAVTYFNKAANIRVIPYAPVALVGLPFTALSASRDYLAIPHEVGHYIYRHSLGLAAALDALLLPTLPAWGQGWLEEIFADVYGALVAGPVIGLSFQDLLLDNPVSHLIDDDGEHPADAVRPYIYTQILATIGYGSITWELGQQWQAALRQRGNPQIIRPLGGSGEVPLDVARKMVEDTAVAMLGYLTTERKLTPSPAWSNDGTADKLYDLFDEWLKENPKTAVNQLLAAEHEIGVLTDGVRTERGRGQGGRAEGVAITNKRRPGETLTWRDWCKTQSRQHPQDQLPAALWREIFTAGGWPVKGPEGGSGGGGYP